MDVLLGDVFEILLHNICTGIHPFAFQKVGLSKDNNNREKINVKLGPKTHTISYYFSKVESSNNYSLRSFIIKAVKCKHN